MLFRKGYKDDMGTDVVFDKEVSLPPGTHVIDLGVKVNVRPGDVAFLVGRTSTCRAGLIVHQCIIDPYYEGNIYAIITNASNETYKYQEGESLCSVVYCRGIKFHKRNGQVPVRKQGRRSTSNFGRTGK